MSWIRGRRPAAPAADPSSSPTPFDRVRALTWPGTRPTAQFVRLLAEAMDAAAGGAVVVAAGPQLTVWCELVRSAWPDVEVEQVALGDDESEVHARLSARGPVDVVLQAADHSALDQARIFQRVFFHLREDGTYLTPRSVPLTSADVERAREEGLLVADRVDAALVEPPLLADLWSLVGEGQEARTRDFEDFHGVGARFQDVRGLGRHLREVQVLSKIVRLRNDLPSSPKLTEAEADHVLAQRPEMGGEVVSLAPATLRARSPYVHNLSQDLHYSPVMAAPKATLRRYDAPVCSRGQVVTSLGVLLPDTFRHHMSARLANIYVEDDAPRFGHVRRDVSEPDELPGAWYHLDSEWPGHFGHSMTEVLGRTWGWRKAQEQDPDVRPLLTLQHDRTDEELLPFEVALLDAAGIDPSTVHVFDRPCRPERLYSATSLFSLPDYVHPEMAQVWRQVGDHLADRASAGERPARLFCSRPATLKRACRNVDEVETLFVEHGFTVVRPEEHPLADQVAMFRAAEAVAGFAGSALFTMALCPEPKPLFTIAPWSYTARNEQLISALWGHPVVSVWSRPEVEHPPGRWTIEAFSSAFTVDMDDEGAFLRAELERLDG